MVRNLAAIALGLTSLFLSFGDSEAAIQPRRATISCTNTSSGARWRVKIDYDKATVDTNHAQISATEITWHDAADGANYALERKSGVLTMSNASSTGGYLLIDHCTLEKLP
jgi:hypothetical protein